MNKYLKMLGYFGGIVACFTLGFLGAVGLSKFDFTKIKVDAKSLPRVFIIESGSMEPAIKTGGIVVTRSSEFYRQNDIVSFSYDKDKKDVVTHRIEYKGFAEGGATIYQTAGDANKKFDAKEISDANIIGKVVFTMPYLGYFADFAKRPQGFILLIVVPATIIIYEELKNLWRELFKRVRHFFQKKGNFSGTNVTNAVPVHFRSVQGSSRLDFRKFAMIIPFFGAFLLFLNFSASFFSDTETSVLNSFTAYVPTPTQAPISPPVADHIVISEVQINGSNANQDFVELYNPTSLPVDLNGWQLQKKTSNGTQSSIVLIGAGKIIPAYGYFLWANTQTVQNPFNVSIGADVGTSANISENNGIALENASDVIIDQIGWGTGVGQYREGTLFLNGSDGNNSMERKAYLISTQATMQGGVHSLKGNGYDAGDNSTDFIVRTLSQPQNSTSRIETP